jgi:hypothetical protein
LELVPAKSTEPDMNMDYMDDKDPIVAEVRRARAEIAAMCNYDDDLIDEYVHQRAKEIQEKYPGKRGRHDEKETAAGGE